MTEVGVTSVMCPPGLPTSIYVAQNCARVCYSLLGCLGVDRWVTAIASKSIDCLSNSDKDGSSKIIFISSSIHSHAKANLGLVSKTEMSLGLHPSSIKPWDENQQDRQQSKL